MRGGRNPDDVGLLAALDLVNTVLLSPGDTVIVEQSNYGGVLSRFKRLGINMVAIDLDHDGMRMDHLERALSDLKAKGRKPGYIYTIPTDPEPDGDDPAARHGAWKCCASPRHTTCRSSKTNAIRT